mmetsp:Transcript_9559/g.29558  ORF Transcript_9559/g.29558 Transcript_9559/m.29558 type:complete len:371 (-) Transcript_9559:59-1171(-)
MLEKDWLKHLKLPNGCARALPALWHPTLFPPVAFMAILALGNPLLDIIADVEPAMLEKYGLELNGAVHAEDKHRPLFAELAALPSVAYLAGGMVQNTIRVAQWMLQVPNSTAFIGCVGADALADKMTEACERDGVRSTYMVEPSLPTGCCAVLNVGAERALCTDLQAARMYSPEHLGLPEVQRLLQEAAIIYCAVLFPAEAIRLVAQEAARRDVPFCANLTAPFVMEQPQRKAVLVEMLPYTDFLFGNEREAIAWGTSEGWETEDVGFIATRLSLVPSVKGRKRTVVVTQGADDTLVAVNGHVSRHPVVPLGTERIVDTTGAGDAYAGGFLAALSRARSLKRCCEAGAYAASVVIQRRGCTLPEKPEHAL